MTILVREEYLNATKGYSFGDSGEPYEAFTDDTGRLYKSLQGEYGKASNVYVDTTSGPVRHVGWAFTKRMRYEDARDNSEGSYYLREVWVTLYEPCEADDPRASVTHHRSGAITRHPFRQLDIGAHRAALAREKAGKRYDRTR